MISNKLFRIGTSHFCNFRNISKLYNVRGENLLLKAGEVAALQRFITEREKAKLHIKNATEYKQNLLDACNPERKSLVFAADIKNIISLTETEEDLKILKKVLLKFSDQKNVISVNSFQFGPEVMRLLYMMNRPSEALSLVQNPNLFQYFQHTVTVLLLIDLLFKNNWYDKVIEISEFCAKPGERIHFISVMHYFASCYKLNTKDSLEKATAAWYTNFKKYSPPLKAQLFFLLLSLNQGLCPSDYGYLKYPEFDCLLENIKFMVLAKGNRFQDLFRLINEVMDSENATNFVLTEEALLFIEENIQNSCETNILKFTKLKDVLKEKNFIVPLPLDSFLCEDLDIHEVARRIHSNEELLSIMTRTEEAGVCENEEKEKPKISQ